MKTSNFDRLIERYLHSQTSESETLKMEAWLNTIGQRGIHWMSDETEELFCKNIQNENLLPADIVQQVMSLAKLHVADVAWMKFKGMDVYFDKGSY